MTSAGQTRSNYFTELVRLKSHCVRYLVAIWFCFYFSALSAQDITGTWEERFDKAVQILEKKFGLKNLL